MQNRDGNRPNPRSSGSSDKDQGRRPGLPGGSGQKPGGPQRRLRIPSWAVAAVLIALAAWNIWNWLGPQDDPKYISVPYSIFLGQVNANNVKEVTISDSRVDATLNGNITYNKETEQIVASQPGRERSEQEVDSNRIRSTLPPVENPRLLALLEERGIEIKGRQGGGSLLTNLLFSAVPFLLFLGLIFFMGRQMTRGQQNVFGFGRSRARVHDPERPQVTFADVAGEDEAKAELTEVVDFLRNPAKYHSLGARLPRGVLLVGPPGTGKTLTARAVAGEAGVPFFSVSASEFVEMFVGVGASRVRDLFEKAKAASPAIIFVDELDAIGRRRGGGNLIGGNDEREQTLNQLLVEMDGFDARQAVIVLGATNRADVLDPALLRPGRFDRRVTVQPPDRVGRAEILKVHTRGVPLAPDVDLSTIASETPGLVGADLRNLVNEAALLAARKGRDAVSSEDFAEALEKIALGAERRLALAPEERERVAYHEAGHALCGLLQPEGDPVRRVTVIPRGQALGVTLSTPEDDRYNYGEPYLRARIVNALGGRAAEQVVYGTVTTGAENDIQQVTDLARAMVTRWGMAPEVGLVALERREEGNFLDTGLGGGAARPFSEETAEAIDHAVRRIIDDSYAKAVDLLTRERARLDALTVALLREESLNEEQMLAVTGLSARSLPRNPIAANR